MRGIRLSLALVVVASLLAGRGGAATGPKLAPRGAGVIASPNVSLLATIPDVGSTGGRFAGGYYFTTISSPVFFEAGPNSGLRIYDYSIPEVPVLVGALPLPHGENEDVDVSVSRKLVLISMDTITEGDGLGDRLYVVSWENPHVPLLVGMLDYPEKVGGDVGGPGHIANCIADCKRYAWVTGARDGSLFVVDLADPAKPSIAGTIPAKVNRAGMPGGSFAGGLVHDVNQDPDGRHVWVTGSGGTALLDAANPKAPKPEKWIKASENGRRNQFIHHNSLRLDRDTVLVTEEDWLQPGCGAYGYEFSDGRHIGGGEQGGFQTWRVDRTKQREGAVMFLDQWITELDRFADGSNPATITCSSHWFTHNRRKVVAAGWYNQGVRFLDVSNPRNIRQVGYFLAPGATASAAYFVPGRDDIVWVADYTLGLQVLRISGGGASSATVRAPIRAEWLASSGGATPVEALGPSGSFGYACRVPKSRPGASAG